MKLKALSILLVVLTSLPSVAMATRTSPAPKAKSERHIRLKIKGKNESRPSSGIKINLLGKSKDKPSLIERKAKLKTLRHRVFGTGAKALGMSSKAVARVTAPPKRLAKGSARATTRHLDRLENRSPKMTRKAQRGFRMASPYSITSFALARAKGDKKMMLTLGVAQIAIYTSIPVAGFFGLAALKTGISIISFLPAGPVELGLILGRQVQRKKGMESKPGTWESLKMVGSEYKEHHQSLQADHRKE